MDKGGCEKTGIFLKNRAWFRLSPFLGNGIGITYADQLVDVDIANDVFLSVIPPDPNTVSLRELAQTEMHDRFNSRQIAPHGFVLKILYAIAMIQGDLGAKPIGVAFWPIEIDADVIIATGRSILIKKSFASEIIDHQVQIAVVVEIANSGAIGEAWLIKTPFGSDLFKAEVAFISQEIVSDFNRIVNVDQILESPYEQVLKGAVLGPIPLNESGQFLFDVA